MKLTDVDAIIAYDSLRRAIVSLDTMTPQGMRELADRVTEASRKYPAADDDSIAQAAMNRALTAFRDYVLAVASEGEECR